MAGTASIAKHPIHPLLISLPIGLWVFSLVSDIIYFAGWGNLVWEDVAWHTMAGGLVCALLAAIPGFFDFIFLTGPKVKKLATTHMILNMFIIVLFAIDLYDRTSMPPYAMTPVILSIIGVVLLGISGWIGGEMVYVHGVAIEPQTDVKIDDLSSIPNKKVD